MSMNPENHTEVDLDRTDELPRLDVAAYEASLAAAAGVDPLSATDTWSVEGLAATLPAEEPVDVRATTLLRFPVAPESPPITSDVDSILRRIAELEAEIAGASALNGELEAHGQSLVAERSSLEKRVLALEADNARLGEHRAIAIENIARLERQLLEQSAQHAAQLAEISQDAAHHLDLQEHHAKLEQQLQASNDLAGLRAQSIADLEAALATVEKTSATLSHNLAVKLSEFDAMAATIERRNATIAALQALRDDLSEQLQRAVANVDELSARLAASDGALDSERAVEDGLKRELNERTTEVAELKAALAAATQESQTGIATLHEELTRHTGAAAAREQELAAARESNTRLRQNLDSLQTEVRDLRATQATLQSQSSEQISRLEAMRQELEKAQRELGENTAEVAGLEQSLRARDGLVDSLRAELQTTQDERAIMSVQVDKARSRAKQLAQDIFQRDSRIASLKSEVAVHSEALAAIRRDVGRAGSDAAGIFNDQLERILEPVDHDGDAIVLDRKIMTIGRTDDNDICIPSKLISRHHARLLVGPNAVVVEDAGSTNGCYVNDREVRQHAMREGDILMLGELKYRLCSSTPHHTRRRNNVVPLPPRG